MATWAQLLTDQYADLQFLIVATGYNSTCGFEETFYWSEKGINGIGGGFCTEPTDTPANQPFAPRIITPLNFQGNIGNLQSQWGGESFPTLGQIVLNGADGGTATPTFLTCTGGIATALFANPHPWQNGDMITLRVANSSSPFNVTDAPVQISGPIGQSTQLSFPIATQSTIIQNVSGSYMFSGLDGLRTIAFDGWSIKIYLVGTLSSGAVIGWSLASANPIFVGTFFGDAIVNETQTKLNVRDMQQLLSTDAQVNLYRGMSHCLTFNGTSQSATFTGLASLAAKTIEFWMRCKGSTGALQVVAWQGSSWAANALDWSIHVDTSGHLNAQPYNGGSSASTITSSGHDYRDGLWHHVCLTIDATPIATFLVDGNLVGATTPGAFTTRTGNLTFGYNGTSDWFDGEIDEIRFWNTNLTQLEIQTYMNVERVADPRMRGYWQCNDNLGSAPADTSGNGLTGALTGQTGSNMWTWSGEGYSDLAGQQKPYCLGPVLEMAPTCVDPGRLIYQVHDGQLLSVPNLYDKAAALTVTTQWVVLDVNRGFVQLLTNPQGTVTAQVVPNSNVFGSAVQYDGASGHASGTVSCPAGSMTMECLAYSAKTGSTQLLVDYNNGSAAGLRRLILDASNNLTFRVRNDAATIFSTPNYLLPTGQWHWIAGVLDTSNLLAIVYVDGVNVAQVTVTGTFSTALSAFHLAYDGTGNFINGNLDQVRLWNVARTQAAIAADLMHELPPVTTGLVHSWRCDENTGSTLTDNVSGGVNLTLAGTTSWVASRMSVADLVKAFVTSRGPLSESQLDTAAFVAMNAAQPGDAYYLLEGGKQQTFLNVLDALINWNGFFSSTRAGLLTLGVLNPPVGNSSGDFDDSSIMSDLTVDSALDNTSGTSAQALNVPYYAVKLNFAENNSPTLPKDAAGIITTTPVRYSFATNAWRSITLSNPGVKTAYPRSTILEVDSSLANRPDALAACLALLTIYASRHDLYDVTLLAQPLSIDVGKEISLTRNRMGMDSRKFFRVMGFTQDGDLRSVTPIIWS